MTMISCRLESLIITIAVKVAGLYLFFNLQGCRLMWGGDSETESEGRGLAWDLAAPGQPTQVFRFSGAV